ncbi:Os09g0363000, partial [Oryza sativa Japonica Group]
MSSLHVQAWRSFKSQLDHLFHPPFLMNALHNELSDPSWTNPHPLLHPQCHISKPPQLVLWDSPLSQLRVAALSRPIDIPLPLPWEEHRTELLDKILAWSSHSNRIPDRPRPHPHLRPAAAAAAAAARGRRRAGTAPSRTSGGWPASRSSASGTSSSYHPSSRWRRPAPGPSPARRSRGKRRRLRPRRRRRRRWRGGDAVTSWSGEWRGRGVWGRARGVVVGRAAPLEARRGAPMREVGDDGRGD